MPKNRKYNGNEYAFLDHEEAIRRIRLEMRKRGITQQQLAAMSGVGKDNSVVSRMLRQSVGAGAKKRQYHGSDEAWMAFLDALDIPLNEVSETHEQIRFQSKVLYLLNATAKGGGSEGIKYGITTADAPKRCDDLNSRHSPYIHEPRLQIEFDVFGLAYGFEQELKHVFDYDDSSGEYVWGDRDGIERDVLHMISTVRSSVTKFS